MKSWLSVHKHTGGPAELIRAELFSIERLEQHAESLAQAQRVTLKRFKGRAILARVKDNSRVLSASYRRITQNIRDERTLTPAAEWFVENFHVIEEQILEIHDDLPPKFYRGLPKLTEGFLKGTPRVYGVAWAFTAHTDSRFDPDWLRRFVRAYQRVDPLTIGELWALAISLRIVLVENLRRLVDRVLHSKAERLKADALADSLLGLKGQIPPDLDEALRAFIGEILDKSFAAQLVLRLRDQGERVAPILRWLDERLKTQDTIADDTIRMEHQEQTAMNTTARNIITSMRLVSALDWAQFFEDVSVVDEVLRSESGYASIDFSTRDLYRHAIEELAAKSGLSELDVSQRVVQTVRAARKRQGNREHDVGYHLISKGRPLFEKSIQCRLSLKDRFFRAYASAIAPAYVGSVLFVAAVLLAIPLYLSWVQGMSLLAVAVFAIAALVPASDLAVASVNHLAMKCVGPRPLPKLDFSKGIPADVRTLVVMPVLLSDLRAIRENLEHLEIHYLSHSEGYLQFGLLTDWTDASAEHAPGDESLLDAAREGIDKLNQLYGPGPGNQARFYLFHRRRIWNAKEGVWMGWERKRGKLHELNKLLRGSAGTTFMPDSWKTPVPEKIRYVITLDADTRMSYGAAYRLVGAMAHPLNRPRFDKKTGRVVEGYGVMQPRITPTLPVIGNGSYYQRIFSGPAGIDPYAFAVSDVYQDLFGEGSFTGKGIYDLDAFEASLEGRISENSVLSHDLLEGIHARAGLVTDVELFEEFPSHYGMAVARAHRWARGDWQLLPWIKKHSLPFIGRWKIFDNLRRSLSAPALLATFLLAWSVPSSPVWLWMIFLLAAIGLAPLQPFLGGILPRRRQIPVRRHLNAVQADFRSAASHIFFFIVFLAHQAAVMTDAILKTLYRLAISRRKLEWCSAAQFKNRCSNELAVFYKRMMSAPLIALAAILLPLARGTEERLWILIPFAVLWAFSPRIARILSLPIAEAASSALNTEDRGNLRVIARKTWRFFETFVNDAHHSLPPDNFQEIPEPVVARRTSPTNIGLYLLSVVSAHDFGWIGTADTVEKIEKTLATVKKMAKHHGHLFNWYDTKELRPLEPRYVSTVDSGNLAGHLWAVAHACRQMERSPLREIEIFEGFADALFLITEAATRIGTDLRGETVTVSQLEEALAALGASLVNVPPASAEWHGRFAEFEAQSVTLVDIAKALVGQEPDESKTELLSLSELLLRQVRSHEKDFRSDRPVGRLRAIAQSCDELVRDMEFGFLFDPVKKIFSIGYQVAEHRLDASFYDLLTSEARLASFVAITKGDVPATHWFRLARSLISVHHVLTLVSWSGSMFEYLMPLLVMRSPANSLLDRACRHAVRRQIAYGAERGVPWGISESAYNVQNLHHTYQYSNFGVPGLGLKQGLSENLVIAPYATALAAMVEPKKAAMNFRTLEKMGGQGRFGFFEALDFTPARLPENQDVAVVRAYMAHHQGMSLISLANTLMDGIFRARFHSEPRVQAGDLLLQERMPRSVTVVRAQAAKTPLESRESPPLVLRRFDSPHEAVPRTHLLSNGRYSVMMTSAGSGYSRWRDLAVTRWREDTTRDAAGTYIFLRDVESDQVWSAGYQPTTAEPDRYEVDFSEDRAEITRRDGNIVTILEVVVSPEDDAEIRRVTLKNTGNSSRLIDVTSYAEMVLAPHAADLAHPAFSNLFIHTEFVPEVNGLLCTRRPRASNESSPWAGHVLVVEGESVGPVQYESNRTRFLGRGRRLHMPMCIFDGKPLSNNAGAVIDPIVSLRCRVRIPAGETVRATFTTVIASSREAAMGLADKYHDPAMFERTVALAWTHAHIQRHYLGIDSGEARLFQDLASRLFYSHEGLRSSQDLLARNTLGPSRLWPHGISGDLPILLVRINEADDADIVRDVLKAHEYWRIKNLSVDLVILNEKAHSYSQELQTTLENLARTTAQATNKHDSMGPQGGIFFLRADLLSSEERILLRTAARVILHSRHGSLMQQIARLEKPVDFRPPARRRAKPTSPRKTPAEIPRLQFFNGLGGFSPDGSEYVTTLGPGQWTPAPWINVIANPEFGFQVSESGSGYTWAGNSRENQITPWSNDPVSDPSGEIFYVRDEETGEVWTPTALPIREDTSPYVSRHGQGYSHFEHVSHGIALELLQFVPPADPIKISRLTLTNLSGRRRKLSVTAYIEWVLGHSRGANVPFIITEVDVQTGAILARNPWNSEFTERVAFADLGGQQTAWTADRAEFLGRNGSYDLPSAVAQGMRLSGKSGAGLDPCAALQKTVKLRPNTRVEIIFLLGQGADRAAATDLIRRYRAADIESGLSEIKKQWNNILGAVQVRTPDPSMDLLLNRWLLYQTLACRMWARCGFYQAGGAYGFRDQLQDGMALLISRPDIAREHILRAAARQFPEGDVQHWWHPPSGRGVRTRISDDLLWLPYVVTHYLAVTGDRGILEEQIPFLESQTIPKGSEDAYFQPTSTATTARLFEHCARALDHSLSVGNHGLPLIGTGDWNDAMNRVGHEGTGESVWLAWFLHTTLWEFAKIAESLNDPVRAEKWRLHTGDLKTAVERHGWDGSWYRRAYFDDGTPLGSAANKECRIDSITQSWGVISGAADPARASKSMASLREHLIRKEDSLVLLLTPPFNEMKPSPGYIQGYLPGVRENGGQYTHAGVWAMIAFAAMGDGHSAGELFSLLNPINHTSTRTGIQRYKVEPYVLAGDVYAGSAHAGRGGWTWYTGSASWMYRAGIEWILGFRVRENMLFIDPCIPPSWEGFELSFLRGSTRYEIKVGNPDRVSRGVRSVEMDGRSFRRAEGIVLTDDKANHLIRVTLG